MDIFGGSSQNWTIFRGYFYFRDFSEGQGTDRRIFLGLLKLQIISGVLESHDIIFFFGGGGGEQ